MRLLKLFQLFPLLEIAFAASAHKPLTGKFVRKHALEGGPLVGGEGAHRFSSFAQI